MNIIKRIRSRIVFTLRKRQVFSLAAKKGGRIDKSTKVYFGGGIFFGKNFIVNGEGIDNVKRSQIIVLPGAKLEIGDYVGMSQVSITCNEHIVIGSHVQIGAGTMIFDTNFHNTNWEVRRNPIEDIQTAKTAPVFIGDDCFIGTRSIICKGVTIGPRSIIAAGSVVVKDIPSGCIAGGNPCKVIKSLQ